MSRANPATAHGNAGIAAWSFKMLAEIHNYEDCERVMRESRGIDSFLKIGPHMTLIHEGHPLDPYVCPKCGSEGAIDTYCTDHLTPRARKTTRTYAVELYTTKIVRYYPDGTFSVSNGGHATPTTMYRLNVVLPPAFSAYHHRKQLGLRADAHGVTFAPISHAARRGGERVLWPLDHSKRIDCGTGVLV